MSYDRIECILIARTEKAVRIRILSDDSRLLWVPRSLINGEQETVIDDQEIGDEIELEIDEWFLDKEGIE